MIEISWVTEQLCVGKAPQDDDFLYLKRAGIKGIVDVRSEYCDNKELIERLGMEFLHLEIDDAYIPKKDDLDKLFEFVIPLLDKKEKIFVHCQNGVGRSPLICVAIMVKLGKEIPDAVRLVEEKHPWTSFNLIQERFIYCELKNLI